jgi:hypothetical protein
MAKVTSFLSYFIAALSLLFFIAGILTGKLIGV